MDRRVRADWYLRTRYPLEYEHIVRVHARDRDLDGALVAAVIYAESRFDPNVRSPAGAIGLMQLLPETAEAIAARTGGTSFVVADLRDPDLNVRSARGTSHISATATTAESSSRWPRTTPAPATSTGGGATAPGSRSRRPATTSARCCASGT